jgi:hypothetical protein
LAWRERLLDPVGQVRTRTIPLVPRPLTLDGKVIGFLDNSKWNVPILYDRLEEHLRQNYDIAGVVRAKKPDVSMRAPDAVIDDLVNQCDVVITGLGD